ncbi:hypothetical protein C4561_04910 [candidate division WWE3 bacterium]|jgi:hypothetical protein|uniref:Uncharacterized protein n=1 Tax=candidate division WWE3 bacterium TaxID=2053526 RepID=A0A3A4ZAX0_UNCKA|nr:MAG: hypothetical protein C4561_04910 [candidate division WWE3 bacterium]
MTTLTHTVTGLALGKLMFNSIGAPAFYMDETTFVLYSGIISNFPDLNMLWKRNLHTHHDDLTHYPVIPFVLSMLFLVLSRFLIIPNELLIFPILWLIHLFLDLYGIRAGIHLFWPFNRHEVSLIKLEKIEKASITKKIDIALSNGQVVFELVALAVSITFLLT